MKRKVLPTIESDVAAVADHCALLNVVAVVTVVKAETQLHKEATCFDPAEKQCMFLPSLTTIFMI